MKKKVISLLLVSTLLLNDPLMKLLLSGLIVLSLNLLLTK